MLFNTDELADWVDENLPDDIPESLVNELAKSDKSRAERVLSIVKYKNPNSEVTAEKINEKIGNLALIRILQHFDGSELVS